MTIEKTLAALFDFQRFEGNPALGALIEETEERCAHNLSDDELAWVSAAGEQTATEKNEGADDNAES